MKKNIFIIILLFSIPAFGQKEIIITLGGGSGNNSLANFYLKDSALSSNRTVDLNGHEFEMVDADGNQLLYLIPSVGAGSTMYAQAYDPTDDDNYGGVFGAASPLAGSIQLTADFNGGANHAEVSAIADATTSSITHTADTILLNSTLSGAFGGNVWTLADPTTGSGYWGADGGGSTQALNQTLLNGNVTKETYIVNDSVATASGTGLDYFELKPQNYNTSYSPYGTQAAFSQGYGYYTGVNPTSGRPNVVGLLYGYNGGFNTPLIAGEPTWGARAENYFEISTLGHSEFHGISPEFKSIDGVSRRLGSYYVNNTTGVTNFTSQINGWTLYQGATDTVMMSIDPNNAGLGYAANGTFSIQNKRIPTNVFNTALLDNGVSMGIIGGVTPSLSYIQFGSPIVVSTHATIGTTQAAAIQAKVGTAGYAGVLIAQVGLTSSNFKGIYGDISTTGTFDLINARNTAANGTIQALMQTSSSGGLAKYILQDDGGWNWAMRFNGGTNERSLYFNHSSNDSIFKIRGDTKDVYAKYNMIIGSGTGTTAPTSTLSVNGSFGAAYVAKTGSYTLTISDYTVNVTSGTNTQTLPTAVGVAGRIYVITNSGSGVVTVGTTSSQTFANVVATPTTLTLSQFNTVTVQSDGANWLRLTNL